MATTTKPALTGDQAAEIIRLANASASAAQDRLSNAFVTGVDSEPYRASARADADAIRALCDYVFDLTRVGD